MGGISSIGTGLGNVHMAKNKRYPSNLCHPVPSYLTKLVQISDLFNCRSASKIHDPWRLLISICHWYRRKVDTKILKSCVFPKSEHSKWRRRHQNNRFVVKKIQQSEIVVLFCFEPTDLKAFGTFLTLWFLALCLRKGFPKSTFLWKFTVFCKDFARRIKITKNVFYNWIKLSKQFWSLKSIERTRFCMFW